MVNQDHRDQDPSQVFSATFSLHSFVIICCSCCRSSRIFPAGSLESIDVKGQAELWRVRSTVRFTGSERMLELQSPRWWWLFSVFAAAVKVTFFLPDSSERGSTQTGSSLFHTTEPDSDSAWFCSLSRTKYSIQSLTSAFQLCSSVCVLAALINEVKLWEMRLFVFCRRAAQTDKSYYFKVVLNSQMNSRRGILHYSEYASIENLILGWKLPAFAPPCESALIWSQKDTRLVHKAIHKWLCFKHNPSFGMVPKFQAGI